MTTNTLVRQELRVVIEDLTRRMKRIRHGKKGPMPRLSTLRRKLRTIRALVPKEPKRA